MRLVLIVLSLLLVACVKQNAAPPAALRVVIPSTIDEEGPPAKRFPDSPFMPAVVRAGLLQCDTVVIESIEPHGFIAVEGSIYFVLYVHRYLWLSPCNQRGGSYWVVCDFALNPVWINPDWGGKPGRCFCNQVLVELHDKMFEVEDDIHSCGDLLTFRRDGSALKATIAWSSNEVRIASTLNARKRRLDSNEPDELVTQIAPVAGHPTWRIVLTQYVNLESQGCAHLIEFTNVDCTEFGVKILACIQAEQVCRPTNTKSLSLPWGGHTLTWIDYESRSGILWRTTVLLRESDFIEVANERR